MLNYQYRQVLKEIAEETFPDEKILPFKVEIYPKEMKTKHGDYSPSKKIIRIFNLSQRVDYIISTALHELAHHCEFSIYNDTGHSKRFYEVFKKLLETAVGMGVVEYEIIREQKNANDLNMLEKHFGSVTTIAKTVATKEKSVIKVLNSFSFKEKLKEKDYFYDTVEKAWGKIIPFEQTETEMSFLLNHTTKDNIIIRSLYDLQFEAVYYVFVHGGFNEKEKLKNNGYFYKQIKNKKGWAKKIVSTDLDKEKAFLAALSLSEYSVQNSLT